MKTFDYNGLWWLPEAPEKKCFGTLRCSETGELNLTVMGSLGDISSTSNWEGPAIIHGEISTVPLALATDPRVTLKNCFRTAETFGTYIQSSQQFFAHRAFFGNHLTSEEDFRFKSVYVRLSGLNSWAHNLSGLKRENSRAFNISYEHPSLVSGKFSEGLFTLGSGCSFSSTWHEMKLTESFGLKFTFNEPVSEDRLYDFVYDIQNFFTFATDHANALTELKVRQEPLSGKEIAVIGPRTFSDELTAAELHPWQMLFSYSDIADRFEEILNRWLDFSKKFPEVASLYFGTQYRPPEYMDLRFQVLVQALSLYHAHRNQSAKMTSLTDRLLRELNESLPPEQARLTNRLFDSHPLVLAERALENLTQEHKEVFQPLVTSSNGSGLKRFTNRVVNTLYYLLTRDSINSFAAARGTDLYWLTDQIAFLLKSCFLKEMGFSPAKQLEIIQQNQRYEYIRDTILPQLEAVRSQQDS